MMGLVSIDTHREQVSSGFQQTEVSIVLVDGSYGVDCGDTSRGFQRKEKEDADD